MKVNRSYITITELPAGARIEQMADGYVLIEGLADATLNAEEAREIREALNVVLSEEVSSASSLIVDDSGDHWWKLPNGSYVCQDNPPTAEEAQRYVDSAIGSTRAYIQESYGIRFEK